MNSRCFLKVLFQPTFHIQLFNTFSFRFNAHWLDGMLHYCSLITVNSSSSYNNSLMMHIFTLISADQVCSPDLDLSRFMAN